jgi:hypothetical protein
MTKLNAKVKVLSIEHQGPLYFYNQFTFFILTILLMMYG